MVKTRDLMESLCQKLDIYNTSTSGKDYDKHNLEEFVKLQGGGASALASISVATRAILGKEHRFPKLPRRTPM